MQQWKDHREQLFQESSNKYHGTNTNVLKFSEFSLQTSCTVTPNFWYHDMTTFSSYTCIWTLKWKRKKNDNDKAGSNLLFSKHSLWIISFRISYGILFWSKTTHAQCWRKYSDLLFKWIATPQFKNSSLKVSYKFQTWLNQVWKVST